MYIRNESSDEPIMLLNKHIGNDPEDGPGIDGALFADELLYLDSLGKKRIQIWINSPGGSVVEGFNIYSAILKTKTKVDTYDTGIAASIAAVIFQAGRKRIMADYGILMYHNAFGGEDKTIEAMNDSIKQMIGRSGMNAKAIEAMMNNETFLDAQEALKLGLCDEIESSIDFNRKRIPASVGDAKAYWNDANKILNKIFNNSQMTKVTNKLNLQDSASEDAIVASISDLQNKLSTSEAQNKKSAEDMAKMKNDLDEAMDKYNKLKGEYENATKELNETKDAAMTEKCKNMIAGFAKVGKIKNEAAIIEKWVEKAKADFDGTKNLLDELPVNKDAVKIAEENKEGQAKVAGYNMALKMAEISNKANTK